MMTKDVRYPHVKVTLVGLDGNAFSIIGRVLKAMQRAKLTKEQRDEYVSEATSSDYNHLLQTTMDFVDCR